MKLVLVIAVLSMIFVAGCKDKTTNPDLNEFEALKQYIEDNNLDLPAMLTDAYITAEVLNASKTDYFIMDIRKGDKYGPDAQGVWPATPTPNEVTDFEDGHIDGAHSVALADVVTYETANNVDNLPVVVACYTGHDAGHAVMALRLSGVATAKSLKWGMSSWNGNFDFWTNHTGNVAANYPESWIDDNSSPALAEFTEMPTLDVSLSSGEDILEYQIDHAMLDGLNGIGNTDVLSNPDNYQVFCYWDSVSWNLYGHIKDAYQVTPGQFGIANLENLDPTATNVFYCWSGQTASFIAAWLNAFGYDTRTLKFSANGMIYDALQSHKWSGSADFNFVTGP